MFTPKAPVLWLPMRHNTRLSTHEAVALHETVPWRSRPPRWRDRHTQTRIGGRSISWDLRHELTTTGREAHQPPKNMLTPIPPLFDPEGGREDSSLKLDVQKPGKNHFDLDLPTMQECLIPEPGYSSRGECLSLLIRYRRSIGV